ncbi:hypothetical protein JX265_009753 [Neoarthrinium moseri]|uniref:Uncharacterized protein n=1 Tax=Neoarthrinium moseri TaxID=1658444 RepID=A0A9P9WFV5_9PEZI|nr:hypothetical protein JX265_009753 [Neoarthrinium moseri]
MPRGRHSQRGSPASSLYSADSRSPSPVYARSRSQSGARRRPSFSPSPARSRPRSPRARSRRSSSGSSRSPSRSPTSRRGGKRAELREMKDKFKDKTDTTSGMKTSLVFLGSVAAATYAAHKYWPKGITYGEKEEWEEENHIKKAKKIARGEIPHNSGGGPSRRGDDRLRVDDGRRMRDHDRPRSSRGRLELDDVHLRRGERLEIENAEFRVRPASVNRGLPDGLTTMSIASGSRGGDARRAQYVEDNRTQWGGGGDRRSYVEERERWVDDRRAYDPPRAPPHRYVDYESAGRRGHSFDEPPDPRRGERVVYR